MLGATSIFLIGSYNEANVFTVAGPSLLKRDKRFIVPRTRYKAAEENYGLRIEGELFRND